MRSLKKYVLVVTPFGLAACASVWGFEEATERATDVGDAGARDDGPVATGDVTPSNVPGVFCAPRPPEGWLGPLSVAEATGSPPPSLAECSERWESAYDLKANVTAPDGGCGCECVPDQVTACAMPSGSVFQDNQCKNACAAPQVIPSLAQGMCAPLSVGACTGDVFVTYSAANPGGKCTPKSKGPPAAPAWLTAARICKPKADVTADCADKAIAPQTPVGFDTNNYCILATRAADECPSTYPRRRSYFKDGEFAENRSCEACNCGPPTGTCAGIVQSGDNTAAGACGGGKVEVTPPLTACKKIGGNRVWGYWDGDAAAQNVQCEPSGGGIIGKVVPAASLTVCCRL